MQTKNRNIIAIFRLQFTHERNCWAIWEHLLWTFSAFCTHNNILVRLRVEPHFESEKRSNSEWVVSVPKCPIHEAKCASCDNSPLKPLIPLSRVSICSCKDTLAMGKRKAHTEWKFGWVEANMIKSTLNHMRYSQSHDNHVTCGDWRYRAFLVTPRARAPPPKLSLFHFELSIPTRSFCGQHPAHSGWFSHEASLVSVEML